MNGNAGMRLGAFILAMCRWLLLATVLLVVAGCQPDPNRLSLFVGPSASSYVDETGKLTIDDVVLRRDGLFHHKQGTAPNEGIAGAGQSRFWLNFTLPYIDRLLAEGWKPPLAISIREPRLQHVELYVKSPRGILNQSWSGQARQQGSIEAFRYPVFILDPADLRDAEVYLQITTVSSMQGLVWLSDFRSFFAAYDTETTVLSVILIYILALGLFLRSQTNLWLAACIGSGLLYIVASNAFLETLFITGLSSASRVLALTSALMIYFSFTGFMTSFLRLRKTQPRLFSVARGLMGVLAITAMLAVADDLLGIGIIRQVSPYLGLLTICFALGTAFAGARRTPGRCAIFILAWLPSMLAGSVRLFVDVTPQIGVSPTIDNSLLFGIAASLVLFTIIASVDIQKREARLKAEILHNAERFRAFAEVGTDIFWEIDRGGKLAFFTGKQLDQVRFGLGEAFLDRLSEATSTDFVRPLRIMADGDRDIWISVSGRPISPSAYRHRGDSAVYRGLIRDVTEEVERESRRLVEQQMFALGQLAGSVAHEINNLIHPIINLTKRLRLKISNTADPESTRMMDLIDISSRQAATVVSELLQSTRGEKWKDIDRPISTAVEHGVDAVRPALPASMRVDTVIEECDTVSVKVGDILQIVGNLVSNAVHAMHGAGTITVTLARLDNGAKLSIADDGAGMEENVRRRAMQPFFSTKVDGRGTGVGLYVVQRIVRDYGGWITIESSPGHGTTVTIFFPLRKDDHGKSNKPAQSARGG
jgi:signal transduction histidine kinase